MPSLTAVSTKSELACPTSATFSYTQSSSISQSAAIATSVLTEVMRFRRVSGSQPSCLNSSCKACIAPHYSKIVSAITRGKPITFVLPAFPGKSPNPAKVLGPLPDLAESLALEFLQYLCERIKKYHQPGARIMLCSDGRVFSDVVGMRDENVTAYQVELSNMISSLGLTSIATFNLEDLYSGLRFDQMRNQLMALYGEPLDALKESVSRGGKNQYSSAEDQEAHRLYCGITRFLFEDAIFPGQTKSRTALQQESRTRAYQVIQRSKAWSQLIEERFPDAVRLSIHPQSCGARKLGIRLIEPDHWQTPWHGVAVDLGGRFMVLKRAQAEMLGGQLVHQGGRPSHYVLNDPSAFLTLGGSGR